MPWPREPPDVTVLLPVHNGLPYLREAIDSLLAQSFAGFELLAVDDGSTDGSSAVLDAYAAGDARVRVEHRPHEGLVASLNHGLGTARGAYVARMDADDVCRPGRIERQVAFMNAHAEIGVCGAWVMVRPPAAPAYVWRTPAGHEAIRSRLLFESAIAHPSVMLRRAIVERVPLRYDPAFSHAEDYELWTRAAGHGVRLANVPEVLLDLRVHPAQVSHRFHDALQESARRIRRRALAGLGLQPTPADLETHEAVSTSGVPPTAASLDAADRWLRRLRAANRQTSAYGEPAFTDSLREQWLRVCLTARPVGIRTVTRYWRSPLAWPPSRHARDAMPNLLRLSLSRLRH